MKLYDQKITKHLSAVGGSLLTVCLYLLLTGVLHTVLFAIDGPDSAYNTVFGIVSFIVATLYWLIIGYVLFGRPGTTGRRPAMSYVFFCLLPIAVFTGVTLLFMYVFPTREFLPAWNMMTWIIAPTLFWYLPFSYLYYMIGYYVSFPLFMGITLLIIAGVLTIGVILGMARRVRLVEHEEAVRRQMARARAQKAQPSVSFEAPEKKKKRPRTKPAYDKDDPFRDDEAPEQIIYTESFEPITDTVIAAHNSAGEKTEPAPEETQVIPVTTPEDTQAAPATEPDETQILPDVVVTERTADTQPDETQVITLSASEPEKANPSAAQSAETAPAPKADNPENSETPQYVPVAHRRKHRDKKPRWIFPGHGKDKENK